MGEDASRRVEDALVAEGAERLLEAGLVVLGEAELAVEAHGADGLDRRLVPGDEAEGGADADAGHGGQVVTAAEDAHGEEGVAVPGAHVPQAGDGRPEQVRVADLLGPPVGLHLEEHAGAAEGQDVRVLIGAGALR